MEIQIRPLFKFSSKKRKGFVLITMAISAVAFVGTLGVAIDIGRMFIAKNEAQAFSDAGALSAALWLDGTATGLTNARNAVSGSPNRWNFASSTFTSPSLTFATSPAGPWLANPSPATGYSYAKLTANAPVPLLFMSSIVNMTTTPVNTQSVAGQVPITYFPRGLAPYTAVTTNNTGPYFGLTVGNSYDIQWPQFNGTRSGCGPSNPDKCFNSPPVCG